MSHNSFSTTLHTQHVQFKFMKSLIASFTILTRVFSWEISFVTTFPVSVLHSSLMRHSLMLQTFAVMTSYWLMTVRITLMSSTYLRCSAGWGWWLVCSWIRFMLLAPIISHSQCVTWSTVIIHNNPSTDNAGSDLKLRKIFITIVTALTDKSIMSVLMNGINY